MGETDETTDGAGPDGFEDAEAAARSFAFVDSTTDIFTHIRPDGEMAYVTSTREMLGRSRQEFFDTPLEEFIHPADEARAIARFESALAGESPKPVELRFRHGDGHWLWIEASASPISPEYSLEGVVTVTREVTDRKHRERAVTDAQAKLEQSNEQLRRQNRRLDRFASVVSHDLRNPLNVATLRLDLARSECDDAHFDAVERSLDRMARMIDELHTLTLRERHAENTTPVAIAQRATTAWETSETGASELRILLDRDVQYEADPGLLDHVFENLFRNAVVHNQDPVTVTVGPLAERPGFYVADTGTGIPASNVDDVLDEGYTTADEGTGFGLGIVAEFVEVHGWELTITESEAGGARFEIETATEHGE